MIHSCTVSRLVTEPRIPAQQRRLQFNQELNSAQLLRPAAPPDIRFPATHQCRGFGTGNSTGANLPSRFHGRHPRLMGNDSMDWDPPPRYLTTATPLDIPIPSA